eukprot:15326637-Heterocapsa_arctica.AAC.1
MDRGRHEGELRHQARGHHRTGASRRKGPERAEPQVRVVRERRRDFVGSRSPTSRHVAGEPAAEGGELSDDATREGEALRGRRG